MGSPDPREVRSAFVTDVGRVRSANQDACAEVLGAAGTRLLVVADGMGGHAGGEVASRIAIEAIGEWFENGGGGNGEMLREAFEAANERVFRMGSDAPHLRGMGTTGVALLLGPGAAAWVAHVGDSRAYRLREGRMEVLTEDHSWVGEEVRNHRLTPEEAEVHPRRSALLRSIGVDPEVDVDVTPVPVESGDRFLLCSDGLWGEVDDETIAFVMASDDPEDSVRRLVELANDHGGRDNVTVQVVAVPTAGDTLELPPMPRRAPPQRRNDWSAGVIAALAVGVMLVGALLWLALGMSS